MAPQGHRGEEHEKPGPESSATVAGVARTSAVGTAVNGITITHADKILWPNAGITKMDLVRYYQVVEEWMLPYVTGRPIAMVRCPDGVDKIPSGARQSRGGSSPCFFHKHPGRDFPGPFTRMSVLESGGVHEYLAIAEPGSLTGLAQMGVLEIHIWGSTWPEIEKPDMIVFDLDPDAAVPWAALAAGARLVRDVLQTLGLQSFVKTTGGKGLHVVVPLTPTRDWESVHRFSRAVAEIIVARHPDRYTANMSKARRGGKIFIDYVRNTRGSTSVAPYSTRAKDRPTVSMPLRWSELSGAARPDTYAMDNVASRLRQLKGDPWEAWTEVRAAQALSDAALRAVGAD
jgi:bifunctional non-homologous end joining protein LigD